MNKDDGNPDSKYDCEFCGFKIFSQRKHNRSMEKYGKKWQMHKIGEHRFKCPILQTWYCSDCNEAFQKSQNLIEHIESAHQKKRQYFDRKCPHCDFSCPSMRFITGKNFQMHLFLSSPYALFQS